MRSPAILYLTRSHDIHAIFPRFPQRHLLTYLLIMISDLGAADAISTKLAGPGMPPSLASLVSSYLLHPSLTLTLTRPCCKPAPAPNPNHVSSDLDLLNPTPTPNPNPNPNPNPYSTQVSAYLDVLESTGARRRRRQRARGHGGAGREGSLSTSPCQEPEGMEGS